MRRVYRQGDVVLVQLDPYDARTSALRNAERRDFVIVGEDSHRHVLENVLVVELGNHAIVALEEPRVLKHDEHPWIAIDPGIYEVRTVRDYALMNHVVD